MFVVEDLPLLSPSATVMLPGDGRWVPITKAEERSAAKALPWFIVTNGALFIRPSEIVPGLENVPIYQLVLALTTILALPAILSQLSRRALSVNSITRLMIGLVVAVVVSHASHMALGSAAAGGMEMAKVAVYYLLLISVVNNTERLRCFLWWLAWFIVIVALLPLMQQHGWIHDSSLDLLIDRTIDPETGREVMFGRLLGVGIFHDPNDLAHILSVGVVLCLYWLTERRTGPRRMLWLFPIGVSLYAIMQTRSRGGLLALAGSLMMLFLLRFGLRKAVLTGALTLPALLMLTSGRQTDFSASGGTSQQRVQTWSDSFDVFRHNLLFGVGEGKLESEVGRVAHNSFVQAYAELGLLGGTLFVVMFALPLWGLYRLPAGELDMAGDELSRLRPYMAAIVAGYVVGMLSLSRGYAVPTFMVLGLVAVYARLLAAAGISLGFERLGIKRMAGISVVFLVAMVVIVRLSVRWR